MRRNLLSVALLAVCLATMAAGRSVTAADTRRAAPNRTLGDVIRNGGEIGWVIIALSVVAVTLAIEHAATLRTGRLAPPGVVDRILDLLDGGRHGDVLDMCASKPGFFTNVVARALAKRDHGYASMEQAAKDAAEDEAIRLHTKVSYLSLISALCPMLGLLGTVVGMVGAFNVIAERESPEPADFAGDISVALITTVFGLIVAIPTSSAFFFFRNRVVRISGEIGARIEDVLDRFRPAREDGAA